MIKTYKSAWINSTKSNKSRERHDWTYMRNSKQSNEIKWIVKWKINIHNPDLADTIVHTILFHFYRCTLLQTTLEKKKTPNCNIAKTCANYKQILPASFSTSWTRKSQRGNNRVIWRARVCCYCAHPVRVAETFTALSHPFPAVAIRATQLLSSVCVCARARTRACVWVDVQKRSWAV